MQSGCCATDELAGQVSRSMKRPRDTSPGPGTSANYGHTARSQRPVDQGRHSKFVEPKVCNPPKCACQDPNPEAPAQVWYNQQQPFVLWQPGCEQMVAPWPWQPSAWHYAPPHPSLIASPPTPTFWQYPTYSWSPPANSPNCNCYYCHHAPAMSSFCYPPAWSTEASPHMDDAPPRRQPSSDTTHCLNRPLKTEGEGNLVKQEAVDKSFFTMLPCE